MGMHVNVNGVMRRVFGAGLVLGRRMWEKMRLTLHVGEIWTGRVRCR